MFSEFFLQNLLLFLKDDKILVHFLLNFRTYSRKISESSIIRQMLQRSITVDNFILGT